MIRLWFSTILLILASTGAALEKIPGGSYRLTTLEKSTGQDSLKLVIKIESQGLEAFGLLQPNNGKLRTKFDPSGSGLVTLIVTPAEKAGHYDVLEKVECNGGVASSKRQIQSTENFLQTFRVKDSPGIHPATRPLIVWTIAGAPVVLFAGKWNDDPFPPAANL